MNATNHSEEDSEKSLDGRGGRRFEDLIVVISVREG